MKFAPIYKKLIEAEELEHPNDEQPEPQKSEDPLISNIDQHWMNPESLKSDLFNWLKKLQASDPEMARITINSIRNVISRFRYKPEASKEQPQ